jgi:cell division septation protein DedD
VRTLDSLGALPGGGADLWFAGRGSPPPATAGLRADAADQARRGARPAPRAAPAPGVAWWVQVSVSRNEAWARALAQELNAGRHRVQVVAPADSSDGWRVMTGPHRSREAADSAGRALGRSYWVVERAQPPQPPQPARGPR